MNNSVLINAQEDGVVRLTVTDENHIYPTMLINAQNMQGYKMVYNENSSHAYDGYFKMEGNISGQLATDTTSLLGNAFSMKNIRDMSYMFNECRNLRGSGVVYGTNAAYAYHNCRLISQGQIQLDDGTKRYWLINAAHAFDNCVNAAISHSISSNVLAHRPYTLAFQDETQTISSWWNNVKSNYYGVEDASFMFSNTKYSGYIYAGGYLMGLSNMTNNHGFSYGLIVKESFTRNASHMFYNTNADSFYYDDLFITLNVFFNNATDISYAFAETNVSIKNADDVRIAYNNTRNSIWWNTTSDVFSSFREYFEFSRYYHSYDLPYLTNMDGLFYNCRLYNGPALLVGWSERASARNAYRNCSNITHSPDYAGHDFSSLNEFDNCFRDCTNMRGSVFIDSSGPINVRNAFAGCSHLNIFIGSAVSDMSGIISGSNNIKIYLGTLNAFNDMRNVFNSLGLDVDTEAELQSETVQFASYNWWSNSWTSKNVERVNYYMINTLYNINVLCRYSAWKPAEGQTYLNYFNLNNQINEFAIRKVYFE